MLPMKFVSMVQVSSENAKPFWSMRTRRVTKMHPSFPSKDSELKDIGHSISN